MASSAASSTFSPNLPIRQRASSTRAAGCSGVRAEPSSAYAAHLLGWLAAPEALPDLIATLGHGNETLRYAATEAILRYSHTAVPALLEALHSHEALIREGAAELLGIQADAEAVDRGGGCGYAGGERAGGVTTHGDRRQLLQRSRLSRPRHED